MRYFLCYIIVIYNSMKVDKWSLYNFIFYVFRIMLILKFVKDVIKCKDVLIIEYILLKYII